MNYAPLKLKEGRGWVSQCGMIVVLPDGIRATLYCPAIPGGLTIEETPDEFVGMAETMLEMEMEDLSEDNP